VKANKPNSLLRSIVDHPWTSVQDAILLSAAVCVAVLLALQYDLFRFADQLTTSERRITLAEAIFLTALLGVGICAFIVRRLHEERRDIARRLALDLEVRELRQQALQDPLTSLPNRRAMLSALANATAGPRSDGHRHAFFLLDLNEFKRVNDLHGHAVGDRVLQVVVERFRAAARPSDVLARLGGDEFAVLSYDVDKEAASAIGHRFIATLQRHIMVEGTSHNVGVSVGATLIPDDGITAQEILCNADLAMYRAKDNDQSSLVFFEPASTHPAQIARTARA
jgi:diguanylate cyclase (GGDEF)-like protein